jgi:hypothetical protein
MRFNPRSISFNGPFNKKKDRHEWRTGGVVGLTVAQWIGILDLVIDYRENDKPTSQGSDATEYDAQQLATVKKIQGWIEAGPQPFDKTKQGLYRSRGDETVLLLEGYHEIVQLLTQVSLRCYDLVKDDLKEYGYKDRDAAARDQLSPAQFATKKLHEAVEKLIKANNERKYNEEDKPIIERSAFSIKRRREEILSAKRFRQSMDDMFAAMDAKRKGEVHVPAPVVERVAPAKPVYVKPEQRPTGPMYDLPTPKVKIGDKLRVSIGRGPELAYYKKQLVRQQLKQLRTFYREWAIENPEKYGKPMKINDGNKEAIRETIRVIETAYEVEVAGVSARPSQPYVANQCYVGGGAGWSGLSYGCALLFRAEQENTSTPERGPNQVAYLLHEFQLPDYHVERYLMGTGE